MRSRLNLYFPCFVCAPDTGFTDSVGNNYVGTTPEVPVLYLKTFAGSHKNTFFLPPVFLTGLSNNLT